MPNAYPTLADILKFNNLNARDVGASNLLLAAPLLSALSATTATQGNKHTFLRDTAAPTVGFRALNTGRDTGKSGQTEVSFDLKIMSANSIVDERGATSYPPAKGGPEAYVARESMLQLKAAIQSYEAACVNGEAGSGFAGLNNAYGALVGTGNNRTVLSAGGVTADGALSSIWFIRTNAEETDCNLVIGNEGELAVGETYRQMVPDSAGALFPGLVTPCEGWVGLQIGSLFSAFRMANINATNKTVTDDLISRLFEQIPEERTPTFIAMNKRSGGQLQRSRMATSQMGNYVPFPREWENIPIVYTSAITNAETQVT
jgi:hypothetical protein